MSEPRTYAGYSRDLLLSIALDHGAVNDLCDYINELRAERDQARTQLEAANYLLEAAMADRAALLEHAKEKP